MQDVEVPVLFISRVNLEKIISTLALPWEFWRVPLELFSLPTLIVLVVLEFLEKKFLERNSAIVPISTKKQ